MGSARAEGYLAVFSGLRTRSSQAAASVDFAWELRDRLSATFDQEGNPLGGDQYGAELEKNRFMIEDGIFSAFGDYIRELEYLRDGLRDNARNYQDAEGNGDSGYDTGGYGDPAYEGPPPGYWEQDPGGLGGTQDVPDLSLNSETGAGDVPAYPQGG
ncbi:hypothetical protein [Microtetraspora malaysiensis]|uniref:hypothetical protein n=1 Tax=Microtetraspora malaysiensis TaxID=161358 RepID=UPI003D8FF01E